MTNLIYTGIGSRETPEHILKLLESIGSHLGNLGYTLRSGGAPGADNSFEIGCDKVNGRKEIWIPWNFFEKRKSNFLPGPEHFRLASTLHPVWEKLSNGAKALHARNTGQILGNDLKTPSKFIVCWTKDKADSHLTVSKTTGGTGTAIKLGSLNNIPIFNLAIDGKYEELMNYIK